MDTHATVYIMNYDTDWHFMLGGRLGSHTCEDLGERRFQPLRGSEGELVFYVLSAMCSTQHILRHHHHNGSNKYLCEHAGRRTTV